MHLPAVLLLTAALLPVSAAPATAAPEPVAEFLPQSVQDALAPILTPPARDPTELVGHAIGPHHQYPDGLMLFLGTMFAPTVDRFAAGKGFTHMIGDIVTVATPKLGTLVNRVNHTDKITPWTFGVRALIESLRARS